MSYGYRTYRTRNPKALYQPLRSVPLFQHPVHVFGPTPLERLTAEVRNHRDWLTVWTESFDKARAALGKANRFPMATRRWHQANALRKLNAVRKELRAVKARLAAAEVALAALATAAA